MTWGRLILVAAVGTLAEPAVAQSTSTPTSAFSGATPATPDGLLVSGEGEVLYDSNVLRTAALSLQAPTAHRDDFRYSPGVTASYGRSSGLISLVADGHVGRDYFQYHPYLDRNNYFGGGTVTYHSGVSCQASINGTYSRRQDGIQSGTGPFDPTNPPPSDVGTVIDNVLTSAQYGANAGCGSPAARLTFGGGYSHGSLSNAAASRQFGNSNSDTFLANIGLGVFHPGQLSLNGSYSKIGYPDRAAIVTVANVPPPLINSGVKTYRIGVSLVVPVGPRLSGTIGASYLHSDPTGGQASYSSPAYSLAVNFAASPRLNLALTGSRDVLASPTAGALFRVVDLVELTGHYTLGPELAVNAHAELIRNDYHQSFALAGQPTRTNDTSTNFGAGITYTPRRLYDVTLGVDQTIRRSDPSLYNYSSTKVSITLAVHI